MARDTYASLMLSAPPNFFNLMKAFAIIASGQNTDLTAWTMPALIVDGSGAERPIANPLVHDDGEMSVSNVPNGDFVIFDGVRYTPGKARKNCAVGTDVTTLALAAVAGKKYVVLGFAINCSGAQATIIFNSKGAGAGTAISETFTLAANGGAHESGFWQHGHFETATGEALTVTVAGSTVGVGVLYALVTV